MSWRGTVSEAERPDDENPYWISFSDMMAGLLILFVLACLVLILELANTKDSVSDELETVSYTHLTLPTIYSV